MAEKLDKTTDGGEESTGWLTEWEKQLIGDWERNTETDEACRHESETTAQMWSSFQNAATTISCLYKERSQDNGLSLWLPFQNSAAAVTALYKESQQAARRSTDVGTQRGHQKRTKEVLSWARKRHRNIRREDLIAYLLDKTPPRRSRSATIQPVSLTLPPVACRLGLDHRSTSPHQVSRFATAADTTDHAEPDLQPFRDALALHGLNGAMSNIRMTGQSDRANVATDGGEADNFDVRLLEEISRHCANTRRRHHGIDGAADLSLRKRSRHF